MRQEARRSTRLTPRSGETARLAYLVKNSNLTESQLTARYGLPPQLVRAAIVKYR